MGSGGKGAAAVIPFSFKGADVRVSTRDGDPWFVLADICRVLEVGNTADAARRLDDDEKGVDTIDTLGGEQKTTVINESGLYSLILTSRKEVAKRFKKWVTAEVLPAIRKTGGYMVAAPDETPEELALRALTVLQATVERQKKQIAEITPKADVFDQIAASEGTITITQTAKALQIGPKKLTDFMLARHWLYRFSKGGQLVMNQDKFNAGLMTTKVYKGTDRFGITYSRIHPVVTPKGVTTLALLLRQAKRGDGSTDLFH